MKRMNRFNRTNWLVGGLLHQVFTPEITTMGLCVEKCGRPARGSGVCARCKADELGEVVGQKLADALLGAMQAVREASKPRRKKNVDAT